MDENFSDPGGHFVGLRCSKMNVEHQDRHTNAEIEANFVNIHQQHYTNILRLILLIYDFLQVLNSQKYFENTKKF